MNETGGCETMIPLPLNLKVGYRQRIKSPAILSVAVSLPPLPYRSNILYSIYSIHITYTYMID